jgi:hypothetical protein
MNTNRGSPPPPRDHDPGEDQVEQEVAFPGGIGEAVAGQAEMKTVTATEDRRTGRCSRTGVEMNLPGLQVIGQAWSWAGGWRKTSFGVRTDSDSTQRKEQGHHQPQRR